MDNFSFLEDEVPFGADPNTVGYAEQLDEMEADVCLQKIANWEKFRKFWLDYYQKKVDEVNQKCDNNVAFQKRKLRDYFESVPHRSTKTMEAYDLPHGRLSIGFVTKKMIPDKEAILARFKEQGESEFVKVETIEKLDWNGYKNRLFISDSGDVLDKETGEIVTDVSIEVSKPEFSVKPTEEKESEE